MSRIIRVICWLRQLNRKINFLVAVFPCDRTSSLILKGTVQWDFQEFTLYYLCMKESVFFPISTAHILADLKAWAKTESKPEVRGKRKGKISPDCPFYTDGNSPCVYALAKHYSSSFFCLFCLFPEKEEIYLRLRWVAARRRNCGKVPRACWCWGQGAV